MLMNTHSVACRWKGYHVVGRHYLILKDNSLKVYNVAKLTVAKNQKGAAESHLHPSCGEGRRPKKVVPG